MPVFRIILVGLGLALGGCTGVPKQAGSDESAPSALVYSEVENPYFQAIGAASQQSEQDRLAILAMQGEYKVGFHFMETVPLKAGYQKHDEKTSGGYEIVLVVRDEPGDIVLQHILVTPGGGVIKHWRQDWVYEATSRFEFVADQTWQMQTLAPEQTEGAWTQCVYEVSDAPRYCGTGKWNHRYGVSTWTSDRSWRPLPRREYTVREDYNAMNAENRHTITPFGWTHEQDNTKTVRDGTETVETLVREFGFNDYRSIEGFDFSPALEYWALSGPYWERVRKAWAARLSSENTVTLETEIDGMPIIDATFEQANRAASTSGEEQQLAIEGVLNEWTRTVGSPN